MHWFLQESGSETNPKCPGLVTAPATTSTRSLYLSNAKTTKLLSKLKLQTCWQRMGPKICHQRDMLLLQCRWRMATACSAITITLQLPPPSGLCGWRELCCCRCRHPSIVNSSNTVERISIWYTAKVFPLTKNEEVCKNHTVWVLNPVNFGL